MAPCISSSFLSTFQKPRGRRQEQLGRTLRANCAYSYGTMNSLAITLRAFLPCK